MQYLENFFVLFLFLFLTSCGNDSNSIFVKTEIKDRKFYPEVIEVEAGRKIILEVINHDSSAEEFESEDLHREKLVPPNSSIKVIFAPLSAGIYHFFGDFNKDTAQGKIIVK